jgi:peptidylprolyl isomerase
MKLLGCGRRARLAMGLLVAVILSIELQVSRSLKLSQATSVNLKTIAKNILGSLSISALVATSVPMATTVLHPQSASAIVANLADVGIREFLVKDGNQFIRLNLPNGRDMLLGAKAASNPSRLLQEAIELVRLRFEQVGVSNPSVWGGVLADTNQVTAILTKNRDYFLSNANDKAAATAYLDNTVIPSVSALVEALRIRDAAQTIENQDLAARAIAEFRSMLLPPRTLPYTIPAEYNALPRLLGRATVDITVESGKKGGFLLEDGKTKVPSAVFEIEVDGYHAPLAGGNFVDLVDKKFYDGMTFQKVEQLIVQTGVPKGSDAADGGYVDPKTKQIRRIPLEIFYKQDSEPTYEITSDDELRATETQALPFQANGAVGFARGNEDVNSGSSQFFLLKWSQALIAPGRNTLDGFYTCMGYITSENDYLLKQITPADKVVSAKVVRGLGNLVRP